MSVNLLRSASAIAISASLALPSPIVAQTETEKPVAELCPDGSEAVVQEGAELPTCPEGEPAGVEPADQESAETAVDEKPSAEVSVETEQDSDVEDSTPEAVNAAPDAAEPPADEPVAENQQAETGDTAGATPEAEELPAEPVDPSARTAESETVVTAEEPAAENQSSATEDSAPPEKTEAPSSEEEDTTTVDATATGSNEEAAQDEGQDESTATAHSDAPEGAAAEVAQDDTEESTAEANQAVQTEAAAAADEGPDTAEQEADNVEVVTEETARSSSEEFATTAAPANEAGGLSNFEKFALGALGVAAAATLLKQNDEVVVSSDDRLVVRDERGNYRVLKNDDELLRRPGAQVATREYSDGSTRTVVTREDGSKVVTIRAPDGQVLKRTRILQDGREVVLFDDTADIEPVEMSSLDRHRPRERSVDGEDPDALRDALLALENPTGRNYSLQQIRQIRAVRELVPEIDLDDVNFETGSAVIRPEEAADLSAIGKAIAASIQDNPNEVFLIEGHTDAVGGAAMNLALSDRRAESAALALTEHFDIPPENLVVQGYGEANLKIRTNLAERENRRVSIRRITPLLTAQR